MDKKHRTIIILAHNIRSAYNIGSFFRTADGVGDCRIVLSGYSARPPHRGVLKTALGAERSVPWESIRRPGPWLKKMKQQGYLVAALEQSKKSISIFSWSPKFPLVLILGNEVRGISSKLLKSAEVILEIPMRGSKESLNVASAMAVATYQLLK